MGSSVQPGVPQSLFALSANPSAAVNNHPTYHRFTVSADGRRFLISQPSGAATSSGGLADQVAAAADRGGIGQATIGISPDGVTVVLNWARMLKQK